MAHAFILTRGLKREEDIWADSMEAQYFEMKIGNGSKWHFPLGVHKISLWELIYPKQCEQKALATIFNGTNTAGFAVKKHPQLKAAMFGLRKMLGAKRMPVINPKSMKNVVIKTGIEKIGIGIKEDGVIEKGPLKGTEAL